MDDSLEQIDVFFIILFYISALVQLSHSTPRFQHHHVLVQHVQRHARSEPQLLKPQLRLEPKVPQNVNQHHLGVDHGVLPADAVPIAGTERHKRKRVPSLGPFRRKVLRIKLVRVRSPDVLPAVQLEEVERERRSFGDSVSVQLDVGGVLTTHERTHRSDPHAFLQELVHEGKVFEGVWGDGGAAWWMERVDFLHETVLVVGEHGQEEAGVGDGEA